MKILCNSCNEELTLRSISTRATHIDGSRLTGYCRQCAIKLEARLKEKCFVEEYNGSTIYSFDGRFYPYWGCHYHFKTIDDCRGRIDNKSCAVIDLGMFKEVMGMQR